MHGALRLILGGCISVHTPSQAHTHTRVPMHCSRIPPLEPRPESQFTLFCVNIKNTTSSQSVFALPSPWDLGTRRWRLVGLRSLGLSCGPARLPWYRRTRGFTWRCDAGGLGC